MMSQPLQGKKIAILVADGFEQVEMTEPRQALVRAGAAVDLVSPNSSTVQGFHHDQKGNSFDVTVSLSSADPVEYDGLVLPGGVMNPDTLRQDTGAVEFVRGNRRGRQADRGHLSRSLDADRGGTCERPRRDQLPIAEDRSEERRGQVGR